MGHVRNPELQKHVFGTRLLMAKLAVQANMSNKEILDYLIDIAHKYQLYKHIRFNTSVEESRWDDATNTWKTKISRLGSKDAEFGKDYEITSDFLVSGVGQLNVPMYPNIKGLDTFQGKAMHSARWDWDYDLRGKKIGM